MQHSYTVVTILDNTPSPQGTAYVNLDKLRVYNQDFLIYRVV